MFTLSTRTIRKVKGMNPATSTITEKMVDVVLLDGKFYGDVPEGEDGVELVARLNSLDEVGMSPV